MQSNLSGTRFLGRSVVALAVAIPAVTMAQRVSVLEEIVVTAEHREATLQETKISISAFDAQAIAERGISNGLDLGYAVPNINVQPYVGGRSGVSYNIRGIGNAETLITFDPAVSVYLDGVLIAKNTGSLLDVLELERIEVLRGPQGTLYGRNTMGGAVNYITRRPSNEFEARLTATVGNYDQLDVRGMLNVPLLGQNSGAGELNVRLSAASLNRDGLQDNVFPGRLQKELGTRDREIMMAQVQWQPTETLSLLYSYDRTRIDEVPETAWVTTTNPARPFGVLLAPYSARESNRPDDIQVNHIQIAETEVDGHTLNLTWDVTEGLTFQSLTGYREMFNSGEGDSDGSPLPALATRDVQENEALSQEFRFIGDVGRVEYAAGLFYMEEKGNVFNETVAAGNPGVNIADYKNEAWAIYGQGTIAITDRFDLTVGARYTEEDRRMGKAAFAGIAFQRPIFLNQVRSNPALAPNVFPNASGDFDNVSWLVALSYDWADDVMTYFKVSTGYQSGGFNSRDSNPVDFQTGFDEETLLAYELGLKSRWGGRLLLNAAVFFSDYDDKRVNQFNPQTLASVQRNAGKVEIWGVEVEAVAQLTDNLQAGLNYGHVDHEYVEYTVMNPDGSISDLSKVSNFPYSPENTASAFVVYEYPLSFGSLRARVDWSYRDEMTFLVPQPERNSSGNVQLWNARLTLDEISGPGDSKMKVSLWGKNLTDESYWNFGVNIFSTFGFDINTYGEPRTYGIDFEIEF